MTLLDFRRTFKDEIDLALLERIDQFLQVGSRCPNAWDGQRLDSSIGTAARLPEV